MKFDIRCPRCEYLIPHEKYASWLRQKRFTGVYCPACGVEWPTKFFKVSGFGKAIKTNYLFKGMNKPHKVQFYASCPACFSFWETRGENSCPFCGIYIETLQNVVVSYVQPSKITTKEIESRLRKKHFKVDFIKIGGM